MFHSRKLNNQMNHKHERALILVYKECPSFFDELLLKDNAFSINHRNLQNLPIEIFKVKLGISPEIMKNVFLIIDNRYDLSLEMPTLLHMTLKLLFSLYQEFGAAFQEVTKNVFLLRNLKQKLNFSIQKTVYENFVKITSIK